MPENFEDKKYRILYLNNVKNRNLYRIIYFVILAFDAILSIGLFSLYIPGIDISKGLVENLPYFLYPIGLFVILGGIATGFYYFQMIWLKKFSPNYNYVALTGDSFDWYAGNFVSVKIASIKYSSLQKIKISGNMILDIFTDYSVTPYLLHTPIENFDDFLIELKKRFKSATNKELLVVA